MRIACLLASLSRQAGGVHGSALRLCQTLHEIPGTEVHILGMADQHTEEDLAHWAPLPTHVFPVQGPREFGYARGLKKKLLELDVDLLTTHGLWMYPTVVTQAWHQRTGRPYLINPHGMLDAWALQNSAWKKRIVSALHEDETLRGSACLRALCDAEADSIRGYGLRNPICTIPNGIDLPDPLPLDTPAPWENDVPEGSKVLLYLGRLHPKKGLPELLRAWALLHARRCDQQGDWHLVIAGWGQGGHETELRRLAQDFGITSSIHFAGPLFGEAKAAAYENANAVVLPSHSEGLPLAVLEAWSHRLPVVMTPACHLPEGLEAHASFCAEPEIGSLAQALEHLFALSPTERMQMGHRGRQLVEDRFAWPGIATEFYHVCRWLIGEAGEPASINRVKHNEHLLV